MFVVVFVLGRPGSGKSQAVRHMSKLVLHRGWEPSHITDYAILYQMFHDGYKQFQAREHDSFDVIDFSVLNDVLKKINEYLLEQKPESSNERRVFFVEFARDDYQQAFSLFDQELLHQAYFLFLKAEIGACKLRILERTARPSSLDDHFVSDEIIKGYYGTDTCSYITEHLGRDFDIDPSRITLINSDGPWEKVRVSVDGFAQFLLEELAKAALVEALSVCP